MVINYIDIDGLNLKDDNFALTPIGLFEGDRDVILNDVYSDGQSYNRGKIKERKLILRGYVKGDILANLFLLKKYLFRPGLKKLTVDIYGIGTFYLYIDLLNWASDELFPNIINCQLVAPDPFLYSNDPETLTLGAASNASLTFPLTFPLVFGASTGGTGTIENRGNAKAYPFITVVGTCNSITVSNNTTGESMSCNVSLGGNDTLIIDNRPATRGIYLNGVKRLDLKNGEWITCDPGDNDFVFTRNSLETKQHCSISLSGRWY